jgi:hypothetical protein
MLVLSGGTEGTVNHPRSPAARRPPQPTLKQDIHHADNHQQGGQKQHVLVPGCFERESNPNPQPLPCLARTTCFKPRDGQAVYPDKDKL